MAYVGNYMVPSYATFVCIHNFVYPKSSNSLFSLLYDFKKLKILILSIFSKNNYMRIVVHYIFAMVFTLSMFLAVTNTFDI